MKDHELLQLYGKGLLSDTEFIILLNFVAEERKKKIQHYRIRQWSLDECDDIETDYRFKTQEDLKEVFLALGIPNEFTTRKRVRFSGFEGFCILIRRLIYPCRLSDLAKEFSRDPSTLSSIIWIMTNWIYEQHGFRLKTLNLPWLRHQHLRAFGNAIWLKGAPVRNIWGFIDGTARQICRPTYRQKLYYSGHKRQHCVKYQSVICPNGLIAKLDGPYQGARHDMFMVHHSKLMEQLKVHATLPNGSHFILYGDPGYVNTKYVMSPYRDPRSNRERIFNATMSSKRVSVEWGFGGVIKKFAYLDFKQNQQLLLQPIGKQYLVAVLLNNCYTCLYGNEISDYFYLSPPNLQTYLQP